MSTPATPVSTSTTGTTSGATTTYAGLTLGISEPESSHDLGISFAPPNVVMTARAPSQAARSIDYLVTRTSADGEIFHVIGDQLNAGFTVHVPILRFRAGDYTVKAFMQDDPKPFGQAAMHITSDVLSR